ncbi:hypothetical protein SAMN05192558_10946 [Actinokineospora alba]|uniref:Uncharacterized protein n=2 Tax=Actinokineospora alba TaxID=504798 RepID=A0A1H0SQJ4_9PSEU|nr:hypothetical protein C8E96_2098 [Actinokineospora alba]SDJ38377.1 hypothetical protein SAMN05421871_114100 [Actinokineospora alba]SDP44042.1 hypothetical protein SAMN05192558_10946 [Actinokineospora alba]
MDSKSCSDGDAGSFNIDEFAPNYQLGTLEFDDCGDAVLGLTLGRKGKYLNKAPTTQPSPEDCESEAKRSSRSKFPVEDIVAGQSAFCVVSAKGNVAWILVASKASKVLGLKVIVWSRN